MELEQLYSEYYRDVYHFVLSMIKNHAIAEEITQETFVKAMISIKSFDNR